MSINRKIVLGLSILVSLGLIPFTAAHQSGEFAETSKLMNADTTCSQMTNDQLANIGEYYLEHMSSETAERTMNRYNFEENARQAHIQIAEDSYCSNNGYRHPHHSDYRHHSYWRWPGGGIVDYFTDLIWS